MMAGDILVLLLPEKIVGEVKEIIEFRDEIVKELGNTNVAVICAGCKSILDMGLTLEYLETKGVPVYGYQTNILPAFYTPNDDNLHD